ncbi:MAG: glycosyltransferase family 2 protein [Anaerolineae bacterium]|jgi:glycosyltransferase involved in cell wall biosynthesis|nr:glycosyltransferase family 2 protein [Anaerolineae bacterium]
MELIIYLPAYNEEKSINKVLAALPKKLEGVDAIKYLIVDDGSVDKTKAYSQKTGADVVSHGRNRGVGAAFYTAIEFALKDGADILVGIDADGQFDPDDISLLISHILNDEADMVIGSRFSSGRPENMSKIKYWGNKKIAQLVGYISGEKFQDVSCGYRAYNRDALLRLNIFGKFTYTHETILSLVYQGLRVKEHPIKVSYYADRKSRIAHSIPRYALRASAIILRVLLDYSPIRVFGTLGSVFFLIGSAFEVFLLSHYAFTGSFTPYKASGFIGLAFIILAMFVFLLALIADMLLRMRILQDRQLYELKKNLYEK